MQRSSVALVSEQAWFACHPARLFGGVKWRAPRMWLSSKPVGGILPLLCASPVCGLV